jgi:hypothetical protein
MHHITLPKMTKLFLTSQVQTMEKSIHGDGKNVFPQGKSLVIHQGREEWRRMCLKGRIFFLQSKVLSIWYLFKRSAPSNLLLVG